MKCEYIDFPAAGEVHPIPGSNARHPYRHQLDAIRALDRMDEENASYSTLVVLPTGGGKTYTASTWLLRHALDKRKKILWLAHRQTLLDQAAESFQKFAYAAEIPHISSFRYRIVSGSSNHDKTINIDPKDDLLIISKDSIGRETNLARLAPWLAGEDEIFLVVDEAHHSTAKTYRRVIDFVKEKVEHVKLIGLTATPFRTAENEQGLLARIYKDGMSGGKSKKNDIGIAYKIDLKELINRQILSHPHFETYYTDEEYGKDLGLEALESIQNLDTLSPELSQSIAESGPRNKLIVDTYLKKADEYGQTIVFAVSIDHAIALAKLFNKAGIKAEYIVSSIKDMGTGVTISAKENDRKLEAFRSGDVEVLVNVNILTEGVDLPMTKTVFLARPTVSTILMTQMIGRALRGEKAGGTNIAYIVSFVDNWNEHIAWVSPDTIFVGDSEWPPKDSPEYKKQQIRWIAISKIEEFAAVLNDAIDTTQLEAVSFWELIPVGMYAFQYINEEGVDFSYQVMVYNSTQDAYEEMMQALPVLFEGIHTDDEYLSDDALNKLEAECKKRFFHRDMVPPYDPRDVRHILTYYAQKESEPKFYTFDQVDRSKLDVPAIAKYIWDEDLGQKKTKEYLDQLWEGIDDNLLQLFFGKKIYFLNRVRIELMKLTDPDIYASKSNVTYDQITLEDLPLDKIKEFDPALEKELREGAFAKAKVPSGYVCAHCGNVFPDRRYLNVDHIIPMNQGGLSVPENLQILCRSCNAKKGDRLEGKY
ncbi:helicase [Selenomonas sp. oral taxon 920]|uniref:DEAD/DEAH box helicase family protein n=1 Tax=Selenomonas sp. oral taxon 920 TaxID=1884263 RepID=UPI000840AC46|nr:DEAD/DEAH box helicase family protein [Selenomonas sp. oral taxon 920]AOH47135.1 helicase [Selenomonas sp. oral taxon 920]